jgi:hypothetical protein
MNTTRAISPGWEPCDSPCWEPCERPQLPLELSEQLPELPPNPRVLLLIDVDCVSYGLLEGTGRRACDKAVRACLEPVHATAARLDPRYRIRARRALSSATAEHHLAVLISAPSNSFTVRYGRDGADLALIEKLDELLKIRSRAVRPGRERPTWLADLVMLVAQDGIYAPPVAKLRLLGTPTWLLAVSDQVAGSLRDAACAVDYIGPCRPSRPAA